ncbi:hypothetical protein TNCV_638611 [Trichonephila clavipes]|nr:hypothetical protein TNCV_638611 [Trichonephila clavipes]
MYGCLKLCAFFTHCDQSKSQKVETDELSALHYKETKELLDERVVINVTMSSFSPRAIRNGTCRLERLLSDMWIASVLLPPSTLLHHVN